MTAAMQSSLFRLRPDEVTWNRGQVPRRPGRRLRPAAGAVAERYPDRAFRNAAGWRSGLFPHQIEGVAFLLGRTRAILADDMGLGKTRQAIVALGTSRRTGPTSSSARRR